MKDRKKPRDKHREREAAEAEKDRGDVHHPKMKEERKRKEEKRRETPILEWVYIRLFGN